MNPNDEMPERIFATRMFNGKLLPCWAQSSLDSADAPYVREDVARPKTPVIEKGMYTNIRDLSYEESLFITWAYMRKILESSANIDAHTLYAYIYAHPVHGVIFIQAPPTEGRELPAELITVCIPD